MVLDWIEKRAATPGQAVVRVLACYDVILKEKKSYFYHQCSVLDFFKSLSATHVSPLLLFDTADGQDDPAAL